MISTARSERALETQKFVPVIHQTQQADSSLAEDVGHNLNQRHGTPRPVSRLFEVELNDRYAVVLALESSTWLDLDDMQLQKMQSAFRSARGILWILRGARSEYPTANMCTGLIRSMRTENPGLRLSTLDLDPKIPLSSSEIAHMIMRIADKVFDQNGERLVPDMEFLELNGIIHIPRVLKNPVHDKGLIREISPPESEPQPLRQPERALKSKLGQIGLLDSLQFEDDSGLQAPLHPDDVEISIKATGMNFKDVMMSLGQIPFYHELGLECSGTISAVGSNVTEYCLGDRVCALAKGAYASRVRIHTSSIVKIPKAMTHTQAASVPIIFCTAQYALFEAGRLSKGESILIHAAAGGVGQAAIMLAQYAGADIYVTVSSPEKMKFLLETYGISENHVFSSRDTSFAENLMDMTNGRGVDVVLNSTAGEIYDSPGNAWLHSVDSLKLESAISYRIQTWKWKSLQSQSHSSPLILASYLR